MDHFLPYFFDLTNFPFKELFNHCPFPWSALQKIESFLLEYRLGMIEGTVSPQAYIVDPHLISIGKGSVVEPGAYIKGPCLIGKNCTIRHGAYIRGNFIAGDGCVIGHDTEVKNSIFLQGALAGHFAYVGDSIIGNKANLGAGTKCANLKLDHETISIQFPGQQTIDTGMRKFGALIGDNCQLGCNSVTNPGTLMGQGVKCYPCINVGGFIPTNSTVKPASKAVIIPH